MEDSLKGGYLDFNQIFENAQDVTNDFPENPITAADNRNPSELSEHIDHVTPDQPQNFNANPDPESSKDKLIRAYISIDRSKSTDPATFAESQNGPNAKQWMEAIQKEMKDLATQNT